MRDKNLLVLTTSYPFDNGTIEGSFVADHCEHLIKNDFKISVICPHHYKLKIKNIINGINIYRFRYFFPTKYENLAYGAGIPTNIRKSFFALIQLPFFLISFFIKTYKLSKNFTLIYAHWTIPAFIAIIVNKLKGNKKIFFMNHGAEVFVLGGNAIGRAFINFILKNCDVVISNSSYTFSKTMSIRNIKNHFIISPCVDINKFKPSDLSIRNKYNIDKNIFLIFSLGYFIERKGFEFLIKSMNIIVNDKNKKDVVLLLGGKGPLKEKYENLINKFKLGNNVILPGYIEDKELLSYYNSCNIFVHPAIIDSNNDTEGLGVVLNEANACGKPVIASSVGGIVDVIKNNENGLLVEEKNEQQLADAILKLKNNPSLLQQLSYNARNYVIENFTWEKNIEKTLSLIKELYQFS